MLWDDGLIGALDAVVGAVVMQLIKPVAGSSSPAPHPALPSLPRLAVVALLCIRIVAQYSAWPVLLLLAM